MLEKEYNTAEFNIGEVAGQTVPHAHIHLIPRKAGDIFTNVDEDPNLGDVGGS